METSVRLPQPENALSPMAVTLSGMVMLLSLVQSSNARSPMVVTLSGILMLLRL